MVLNSCCHYHRFDPSDDRCGSVVLGQHGLDRVTKRLGDEDVLLRSGEDVLVTHLCLHDLFMDVPIGVGLCLCRLPKGCLVFLLFELLFGGDLSSHDRIELSYGVPASIAALRAGRRVKDAVERPFSMVVLSEWMQDDVDHSELIVSQV